jgi:hypothetical protein
VHNFELPLSHIFQKEKETDEITFVVPFIYLTLTTYYFNV